MQYIVNNMVCFETYLLGAGRSGAPRSLSSKSRTTCESKRGAGDRGPPKPNIPTIYVPDFLLQQLELIKWYSKELWSRAQATRSWEWILNASVLFVVFSEKKPRASQTLRSPKIFKHRIFKCLCVTLLRLRVATSTNLHETKKNWLSA